MKTLENFELSRKHKGDKRDVTQIGEHKPVVPKTPLYGRIKPENGLRKPWDADAAHDRIRPPGGRSRGR